jgi:hypothetical protein
MILSTGIKTKPPALFERRGNRSYRTAKTL